MQLSSFFVKDIIWKCLYFFRKMKEKRQQNVQLFSRVLNDEVTSFQTSSIKKIWLFFIKKQNIDMGTSRHLHVKNVLFYSRPAHMKRQTSNVF